MTIADRIRLRRSELNLSQAEVAQRAGYTDKTSISKFENAGNNITMKQVKRVAKALETTSAYLMGWEDTDLNDEDEQEKRAKLILALHKYLPSEVVSNQSNAIDEAIDIINQYENLPPEKRSAFLNYLKFLESDT